ncbi:hypothetical protein D3C83_122450 [compost metagenome]
MLSPSLNEIELVAACAMPPMTCCTGSLKASRTIGVASKRKFCAIPSVGPIDDEKTL